jgi:hypothetical protein
MLPNGARANRDCEVQLLDTAVYPEDLVASGPLPCTSVLILRIGPGMRASNRGLFLFIFEFSLRWHRDTTLATLRSGADTDEQFFLASSAWNGK